MRVPSSGQPTLTSLPGRPVILTRPNSYLTRKAPYKFESISLQRESIRLREGGALTLRLHLHRVQRHMRYCRGVALALQVVGDRVTGNVCSGCVVVNLQVSADVVVYSPPGSGFLILLSCRHVIGRTSLWDAA